MTRLIVEQTGLHRVCKIVCVSSHCVHMSPCCCWVSSYICHNCCSSWGHVTSCKDWKEGEGGGRRGKEGEGGGRGLVSDWVTDKWQSSDSRFGAVSRYMARAAEAGCPNAILQGNVEHCTTPQYTTLLKFTLLYIILPNRTAVFSILLHCTLLYWTLLHCTANTAFKSTALHCTALHCTALHWSAPYFTSLNWPLFHHTS